MKSPFTTLLLLLCLDASAQLPIIRAPWTTGANGSGLTNLNVNQTNLLAGLNYTNYPAGDATWGSNAVGSGNLGYAVVVYPVNTNNLYMFSQDASALVVNNSGSSYAATYANTGDGWYVPGGTIAQPFKPISNILFITAGITNTGSCGASLQLASYYAGDGHGFVNLNPSNAFNTPLTTVQGGSGSNDFTGAVQAAVGAAGYAVTNPGNASQIFSGNETFNDGAYIGAINLSVPSQVAHPFQNLLVSFFMNTNLMTKSFGVGKDCLLKPLCPNPWVDVGWCIPRYGTNHTGNIFATNSDGVVIYEQDSFGPTFIVVQDANTNGEANQANSHVLIMNGTSANIPFYFSENVQLNGESGGGGANQHGALGWDDRGFADASKPAGWHFMLFQPHVYTFTNTTNIDVMFLNATNGNVNISSNLYVGALTVTNTATLKGGQVSSLVTKSASYTLTTADYEVVHTGSSGHTFTLPTAVGVTGQNYIVKNSGTATCVLNTTSSQTIFTTSAVTSITLQIGDSYKVASDGSNWHAL